MQRSNIRVYVCMFVCCYVLGTGICGGGVEAGLRCNAQRRLTHQRYFLPGCTAATRPLCLRTVVRVAVGGVVGPAPGGRSACRRQRMRAGATPRHTAHGTRHMAHGRHICAGEEALTGGYGAGQERCFQQRQHSVAGMNTLGTRAREPDNATPLSHLQ